MELVWGIALGFPIAIVQGSFFEWAFHRYWLHRPWLPKDCFTQHTLIHHQLCKFEDTFHIEHEEQQEAVHFMWWGGPALIAINIVPWAILSFALHASGASLPYLAFLITFASVLSLYYVGYEGLHFLMHKPTLPFMERSRFFQFIKQHHRIHHVHMNRNLNVLIPLADLMLGTLVTEMPSPRTTPESARKIARRHSRFGRELDSSKCDPIPERSQPRG